MPNEGNTGSTNSFFAVQPTSPLELGEIVAAPQHPAHRRHETDATLASSIDEGDKLKQDEVLAEEGLRTDVLEHTSRQARSSRGSLVGRLKEWKARVGGSNGSESDGSGSRSPSQRVPEGVILAPIGPWQMRFDDWLVRLQMRRPRLGSALLWVRGPSPAHIETVMPPFPLPIFGPLLFRLETWCTARLMPIQRQRHYITPLFFLAWLLALTFLVRASFFTSSTNVGTPNWLVATTSYWEMNDGCGINGTGCEPFSNYSYIFRCPAQTLDTQLLNYRTIGADEVIFEPLVVGGMDDLSTYRADSWICAAAIHHGLFGNRRGGCGELQLVGEFENYEGGKRNGVHSIGFPSAFPSSYRFVDSVEQGGCRDLRNDILGFDVAMTVIFSFFIRPAPQAFFWGLFVFGYWHVVLASDPTTMPPDVSTGFKYFLPALFVAESFWRHCWRFVVPAFEKSGLMIERTVWYLAGFWMGLLVNISLAWIPIDRLTPSDISREPGGLIAVICIAIFLFFAILNQLRVIRRTGWFFFYLKWYAVGGIVIGILSALPGLEFRLHHYVAGICLMAGTAFVTRPSAIFQGFLMGLFLDGIGRWGFDSILETAEELVGDGTLGTSLPNFLTNSTNFASFVSDGFIQWMSVDQAGVSSEGWNGFALLVDDVLRQTGAATNFSLAGLDTTIPHFFRLAYQDDGTSGDFTKAATAYLSNNTWINPASGAS
ncbi:hypothetical protein JCM21900_000320 [Sporobolomyces salmonicolor]